MRADGPAGRTDGLGRLSRDRMGGKEMDRYDSFGLGVEVVEVWEQGAGNGDERAGERREKEKERGREGGERFVKCILRFMCYYYY